MTAVMMTLMPFNEEIRTVFCTDNMTNNIQYGVTSHYSSICIPNISQWSSQRVDQELCKRGGAKGSEELRSPVWSSANSQ